MLKTAGALRSLKSPIKPFQCKDQAPRALITKGIPSPIKSVPLHIQRPKYILDTNWKTTLPVDDDCEDPINQSKIIIHTPEQQNKLRASGALAKKVLIYAGSLVQPGVTTDFIDTEVHKMIIENNAYPSPLGYHSFPKSICTSVNEVICHGIPDSTVLQEGDMVKIDITVFLDGFHGDNCMTFIAGESSEHASKRRMIDANTEAVDAAIAECKPGQNFHHIGTTIERIARNYGYLVPPEFVGHGIGEEFHAHPLVLHYANFEVGTMEPGMCFTIEPCFKEGTSYDFTLWDDKWTVSANDMGWSSQREHTILITETGAEVLTS